jgi:ubiquinone/menaquinone biosynthesis C-methylase UbiE
MSFGPSYGHLDSAEGPEGLLTHLDRAGAVPAVGAAKAQATAALALHAGQHVLEVGCGTGFDALAMLEQVLPGGSMTAVDASERAVEAAQRRFAEASPGGNIRAVVADVYALPFVAAKFDACRADRVFLHLTRPQDALVEIRRVLKHGGRLAILEIGRELRGPVDVIDHPVHHAIRDAYWARGDARQTVVMFLPLLLKQAGFSDVGFVRHDRVSHAFEDANTLLRLTVAAEEAVSSGRIAAEEARNWIERVRAQFADGTTFLEVDAALVTATAMGVAQVAGSVRT